MDYLIRDAYFTGTKYGEFDRERILRTLRVREGQLVIKQSGVYAVENYIMARYHMYWQIYYHPVARNYERVLLALFRRLRDLHRPLDDSLSFLNPLIMGEDIPLPVYFRMDEHSFSYAFLCLCEHEDAIVSDLARRIRDRRLFEYIDADDENRETVYENLIKAGYDPRYYWRTDGVMQIPYVPYQEEEGNAIWVSMKNGEIREVSDASSIVHSLIHGESHDDNKVFFPDYGGNDR
jgi:HD superfamily phosphohydrolase